MEKLDLPQGQGAKGLVYMKREGGDQAIVTLRGITGELSVFCAQASNKVHNQIMYMNSSYISVINV